MGQSTSTENSAAPTPTAACNNAAATDPAAEREKQRKLEFADACLVKANQARELGDHFASLGWLEQALLVRSEVVGSTVDVNYNQPYIANVIAIGETHLSLRRFDRALIYFLRAKTVLDPLMKSRATRHTSAPTQYVNLTAGLALVLTAVAKNGHKATLELLEGENPLRVAEQQLENAVIRIVALEGTRAPLLVSLYHILARVYLMTNKRMAALRVMQRCLGLTLHISQTKKVFSFLSYTRNVLDTIKELTLVERVVIKIQQWYRDRRSLRLQREMMASPMGIQITPVGSMSTTKSNNNYAPPPPGANKPNAAAAKIRTALGGAFSAAVAVQSLSSPVRAALPNRTTTPTRANLVAESVERHSNLLKATSSAHFLPSPALLHAVDSDEFDSDEEDDRRIDNNNKNKTTNENSNGRSTKITIPSSRNTYSRQRRQSMKESNNQAAAAMAAAAAAANNNNRNTVASPGRPPVVPPLLRNNNASPQATKPPMNPANNNTTNNRIYNQNQQQPHRPLSPPQAFLVDDATDSTATSQYTTGRGTASNPNASGGGQQQLALPVRPMSASQLSASGNDVQQQQPLRHQQQQKQPQNAVLRPELGLQRRPGSAEAAASLRRRNSNPALADRACGIMPQPQQQSPKHHFDDRSDGGSSEDDEL